MQRERRSGSMKEMIERTLEILKDKVKGNLLQIQNNQSEIRKLLKEPVSDERSIELEEKYALNKILLAENNDFINVQLTLTNFFDKYSTSEIFAPKEKVNVPAQFKDKKDCFDQTIRFATTKIILITATNIFIRSYCIIINPLKTMKNAANL